MIEINHLLSLHEPYFHSDPRRLFYIATLYVSSGMTKRAQKDLKCVSFLTREDMQIGMKLLSGAKVFYTLLHFTPSAQAYAQAGISNQAPHQF